MSDPFDKSWDSASDLDGQPKKNMDGLPDEPRVLVSQGAGQPAVEESVPEVLGGRKTSEGQTWPAEVRWSEQMAKDYEYARSTMKVQTVDPLWDRYFELAFKEYMAVVAASRREVGSAAAVGWLAVEEEFKDIKPVEWAAERADLMLAERSKRVM